MSYPTWSIDVVGGVDDVFLDSDGEEIGRAQRFREQWEGVFKGKFAGLGNTKDEARLKVQEAYERSIEKRRAR